MALSREDFDAERLAGRTVVELIASGVPRATAYKWESKRVAPVATPIESADPTEADDEKAPKVVRIGTGGKGEKADKLRGDSKESITEKTAAKIMEGIFLILAVQQQEEEWALSDTEKRDLAGPLSDSLAMLPSPLAKVVNEYAVTAVLST